MCGAYLREEPAEQCRCASFRPASPLAVSSALESRQEDSFGCASLRATNPGSEFCIPIAQQAPTPAGARPRGSACGTATAGACPTRSSAACRARRARCPSAAARRLHAPGRDRPAGARRCRRALVSATTTSAFLALAPVDAERDHVAGAHAVDVANGPLDVLGEHVAAADDDHVLDPTAHHQLAVDEVREVAGAQPAVVERSPRSASGRL